MVQAINCGQLAGGTLTINPAVFTNQGTVAVSNGETLNVNASGSIGGFTVSGSGSRLTFNGSGYVIGQPLTIGAGTTLTLNGVWTNASTITATGATLNLGDGSNGWTNTGTIHATDSTVNLGGAWTLAGLGTFNRTGGTVNLTGTLDNTGGTLALDAATGSWNLLGGTIKGGTITMSGGAQLVATGNGGTLDGVTLASDLDLASTNGAFVYILNGLTLDNATVWLGNAAGTTYGGCISTTRARSGAPARWCWARAAATSCEPTTRPITTREP